MPDNSLLQMMICYSHDSPEYYQRQSSPPFRILAQCGYNTNMEKERLQKILAKAGFGSRRACETIIEEGRVTIDGLIAKLGDVVDPDTQKITVDGVTLNYKPPRYTYIMLHKPRGVLSSVTDPFERRTVRDMIPLEGRFYPVGRLDADSEGLVLLTDDGELTQRLTHPSYEHPRVYRVLVHGEPSEATLERWLRGITLDDRPTRCDDIFVESVEREQTWLRITVHEGRKHLVRRIVAALGHPAIRLIRISLGPLELGDLPIAKWRHLTGYEIRRLTEEMQRTRPRRRPRAQVAPSRKKGAA